jgi:NADPH:quinone reductase-like Zn-dependent oxidoreductase
VRVDVKAAALNQHDLWTLRGVGIREEQLPIVLGCDAAGIDPDGHEVIVHAVISSDDWRDDETLEPHRSLLSEVHDGTFARHVVVPRRNVIPKPPSLSFAEAACLPTAWLTAYRMLFTNSQAQPGATILVQGAGRGVSTALIVLGRIAGYRMWITSRSEAKRVRALEFGAHAASEPGARLPERVDAVMEPSARRRGVTRSKLCTPEVSSPWPARPAARVRPQTCVASSSCSWIIGSTMGTRDELIKLSDLCETAGVHPLIDATYPLQHARAAFERVERGDVFGKIVLTV